jgi:hypothetical protein
MGWLDKVFDAAWNMEGPMRVPVRVAVVALGFVLVGGMLAKAISSIRKEGQTWKVEPAILGFVGVAIFVVFIALLMSNHEDGRVGPSSVAIASSAPSEPVASSAPSAAVDMPPNLGTGAYLYHVNAVNFGDSGPMRLGSNAPNAAPVYVVESAVNAPHGVIQNGTVRNINSYIEGDPVIQNGNVENVGGAVKGGVEPAASRDGGAH